MNKRYSIADLISEYYEKEFLATIEISLPNFSIKHNRKMIKIFDVFKKNKIKMRNEQAPKITKRALPLKRKLLIAAIIILALALLTGCIMAFTSKSFRGLVYHDNTHLFTFDIDNSPIEIGKEYRLSVIPDGYEFITKSKSNMDVYVQYKNANNEELTFIQTTKNSFSSHINTEGFIMEKCAIANCDAVCVEYEGKNGISSLIIWNSSDYILELHGNFTKEELIDLANINEMNGF